MSGPELMTIEQKGSMMQTVRKAIIQHWPIIVLITINLLIGLVVVRDYGQSWDEPGIQKYAGQALSAYGKLITGENPPAYESDLMYYGPAFGMLGTLMVRALEASGASWLSADYWHLVYFLSFQTAVLSLYFLSRRWIDRWAAFGVALLFTAQPLLWGHAFINSKDIPFLAFFLMSITLGFRMVDRGVEVHLPENTLDQPVMALRDLSAEWGKSRVARKVLAIAVSVLWICTGAFLLFFKEVIDSWVASLVIAAYGTGGQGFWGGLFVRLAPNAADVPVASYVHKAQSLLVRWEGLLFVLSGLGLALVLLNLVAPLNYRRFINGRVAPGFKACQFLLKKPFVYWAAISLGLTISIRVLGPYAGILVGLFAIWKTGKRSLFLLFPYFGLALLASYLTWPFLWRDPAGRFLESVQVMSRFVQHGTGVEGGSLVDASVPPWLFLPKLMTIQLTEPLLIVFLAGLILALIHLKDRKYLEPLLLWTFWFLVPVVWMAISSSSIYDNFRQLFFVLPPLFIMGGLALNELFHYFKRNWPNGMVIAVLVLPAIYACLQLHPYEYIYYNSLVGGVEGAFRHYELDYWVTSYKEAAEYLNKEALPNATIGVVGTDQIFKPYARLDLKVNYFNGVDVGEGFDYVVISSRANNDLAVCPGAKVIKTIEREGAVLTAIKRISSPEECKLSP